MNDGRKRKERKGGGKEGMGRKGKKREVELLVCSGFHMVDLYQTKIVDCLQPETRETW